MINRAHFYAAVILLIGVNNSFAASFDCAKAQRPLEKLICSNPQLNSADEQMGQTFKEINASFPLQGFALLTQRRLCDLAAYMIPTKGGFKTDQTDDVIISVSDAAVQLSGFISCSPRTGIADGTYKRIK